MPRIISAEPLAQMIRSITLHKRTGMLRVEQLGERSAERGEIYFENGSLIRAQTEREKGKAALQRIGEWKQITCSFQGMSRPYRTTVPLTASSQEPKVESTQPRPLPETDRLARMPELLDKEMEPGKNAERAPMLAGEPMTRPLNPRRAEIALSANARSAMVSLPVNHPDQPLVVHGTRLETYAPAQRVPPSRSVQRWTTHVLSELETLPAQRYVPPTPYSDPKPAPKELPGRMAIFKAQAVVSVAQVIGQMERHARVVFILLDGRRTIQDIARLTHQAEYEVEQILVNLTQRGYTHYVSG